MKSGFLGYLQQFRNQTGVIPQQAARRILGLSHWFMPNLWSQDMCGSHYEIFSWGEPLRITASQHEADLLLSLSGQPRRPARKYKKKKKKKSHCRLHYPALFYRKGLICSTLRAGKQLVFIDGWESVSSQRSIGHANKELKKISFFLRAFPSGSWRRVTGREAFKPKPIHPSQLLWTVSDGIIIGVSVQTQQWWKETRCLGMGTQNWLPFLKIL